MQMEEEGIRKFNMQNQKSHVINQVCQLVAQDSILFKIHSFIIFRFELLSQTIMKNCAAVSCLVDSFSLTKIKSGHLEITCRVVF